MYISKMYLDGRKRKTALSLSNRELLHAAIESSAEGERPHILWRLEPADMSVILVSKETPRLDSVQKQFGDERIDVVTKPYDTYVDSISDGDLMRFKIEVNPVVNVKNGKKNGSDVPLNLRRTKDQPFSAEDWTVKKLTENGSDVISIKDVRHEQTYFVKDGKRIPLFTVTYSGVFRVKDAETVKRAMKNGIGGKKTYGCGLLSAVRIGKTC